MKPQLSAEEILNQTVTDVVEVETSEGVVYVKPMTIRQADRYEASLIVQRGQDVQLNEDANLRAKALFWCLCDETGRRLFTKPADLEKIGRLNPKFVEPIYGRILVVSGLNATQKNIEQEVEDVGED